MREAGAMRTAPEMLDPVGRHPLKIALEHILGHAADDFRRKAGGVDLANAGDPAGCCQAHEDKIATAKAWRRCADNEGFQ